MPITAFFQRFLLCTSMLLLSTSQIWTVSAVPPVNIWRALGPEGGDTYSIAINPLTPTTLYAGTQGGGVFKSTNGGTNWNASNTGLTDPFVWDVAIDPLTPEIMYAAANSGLFKTIDGGDRWTRCDIDATYGQFTVLAIDPVTPTTLYAGAGVGMIKSTNSCASWSILNLSSNIVYVLSMAIDPLTPSTIYAGSDNAGVFKSDNAGQTWTAASTGLASSFVRALVIDPKTPSILYAGTDVGMFKSTNSAASWSPVTTGLANPMVDALAIDPDFPEILYAGTGEGVLRSPNASESWTNITPGPTRYGVEALAVDPINHANLYAGVYNYGILKSPNGGIDWSTINSGLTASFVSKLAVDPKTPSTLYAIGNGLYKSTNSGANWSEVLSTVGVLNLTFDVNTPAILYASTYNGVYKSTNSGEDWSASSSGITCQRINVVTIDPVTPAILYAGTETCGVFKSTNSGEDWTPFNTNQPNARISILVIDPVTPTTLYVETSDGVYKSTDGLGWFASNTWLPYSQYGESVLALAIDPAVPTTLYAGTNGNGIFKSINAGTTWNQDNDDLTRHSVVSGLVIDPVNSTLYAGTYHGVYKSINGGKNWNPINTGLTNLFTYVLASSPAAPEILYTGTRGGGVFSIELFNPAPTLTDLDPSQITTADPGFSLEVSGSNFLVDSVVKWDNTALVTTFVSSTRLNAAVPASLLSSTGTVAITVTNSGPGGGVSSGLDLNIVHPAPTLTGLDPAQKSTADLGFSLEVSGSNFLVDSVVKWDNTALETTFVSSTRIDATVPASLLSSTGTAVITVTNSGPGGGVSSGLNFNIVHPAPSLSHLNPPQVIMGSPSFNLQVSGQNFVSGVKVVWNGVDMETSFISSSQLSALVPAVLVQNAGLASLTVQNPTPNMGESNSMSFTISLHSVFIPLMIC